MFLLFFTALLSVAGGFLYWMGRSRESLSHYRQGLVSVYAAESGANWALAYLKKEKVEKESRYEIPVTGHRANVTISPENDGKGKITSYAMDEETRDHKRYVNISYSVTEKEGKRVLVVEEITSERP